MPASLLYMKFDSNSNSSCIFAINLRTIGGIWQTESVEPFLALFWAIESQNFGNIVNANVRTITEKKQMIIITNN